MTKEIQLSQGKVALVSDHRFEYLNRWKWYAHFSNGNWYARRNEGPRPFQKSIRMHRVVMGLTDSKLEVDHRDGNGLNNQDDNLRVSTRAQNGRNRKKDRDNISGYKGVTQKARIKRWEAKIRVDGKDLYLGLFDDPVDAARAYDEAAKKLHGEFAKLNFEV